MSTADTVTKTGKKPLPYAHKGDLTQGATHKHLMRMTLPMIWGLFAVIAVQVVDTYFVSLLGTQELAGISFTFPVTMFISHLLFGVNIAVSSVVARLIGQKQRDTVRRIVLHALMLALAVSTTIAALTCAFLEPLFKMLGADAPSMDVIWEYMPIWLLASIALTVPVTGNSAIRASGHVIGPAMVMTLVALTNLVLDPILIFGYFGLPALGVKGAAIATLMAYIVGGIAGLYLQIKRENIIATDGLHLDQWGDSMRRMLVIAIPAGIVNIIMPATSAVITALLASHSAVAVAAYGVAARIEGLAMIMIIALSSGMAPVVGQNWGAELYNRVHRTIHQAIGFNFAWCFMVALVFGFAAEPIIRIFSDDPAVIEVARFYFVIVPFSYAFGNLIFGWASSFNAMGMPRRAFTLIAAKAIFLLIPAIYIGSYLDGVRGIFCAIATVNVVAGITAHALSWKTCLNKEKEHLAANMGA